MPKLRPRWEKYKITGDNQTDLNTLQHVAHIRTAFRIFEDKRIKAGLINDESKLNKSRILVTWLSPNTWYRGYRYGNVSFEVDFKKIIKRQKLYWVETIPYQTPACRILVTTKEHPDLPPYDPRSDDGPLRYKGKEYARNGNICLEFMLENDMELDAINRISFVKHHPESCCIDAGACMDKNRPTGEVSAVVLAHMLSNAPDIDTSLFTLKTETGKIKAEAFDEGIDFILLKAARAKTFLGAKTLKSENKMAIIKASMAFIVNHDIPSFLNTIAVLESYEEFEALFLNWVKDFLSLSSIATFRSE